MPKFHFISGLPRSGSTLLSAILSQNPRFQASMSGPVAGIVSNLLETMSSRNEFAMYINDTQRKGIIQSVFSGFYEDTSAEVVFDTSRAWCARMPLLNDLYPESKVIACVRNMPWVIDSIERLVQKNVFQPSSIFNYLVGGTVYARADRVAKSDGMVGFAFDALKEAYYGQFASGRLLLLQYESLVADPERTIQALYQFIGEPAFKHDFKNIEFDATEFDERAGTPGLHQVRPTVSVEDRSTVLPPDIFNRFAKDAFWLDQKRIRKNIDMI